MNIFDDLKAKADVNGDGKIDKQDLDSLKGKVDQEKLRSLQDKADQNGDGKVNIDDLKDLDLPGGLDSVKDKILGKK